MNPAQFVSIDEKRKLIDAVNDEALKGDKSLAEICKDRKVPLHKFYNWSNSIARYDARLASIKKGEVGSATLHMVSDLVATEEAHTAKELIKKLGAAQGKCVVIIADVKDLW